MGQFGIRATTPIDATKAKAIRTEVNALLGQLRPRAVALVNGFAIPDQLLAAPIGVSV